MSAEFVHLHVHSEYSLLDSSIRVAALAERVAELGMPAVAVTDHDNMFAALHLHRACAKAGVKPIFGCELHVYDGDKVVRDDAGGQPRLPEAHHLVLLAAGQQGYCNLIRAVSRAWVEAPASGQPRLSLQALHELRHGLVGLSACMGGMLAQAVLMQGEAAGMACMGKLRDVFEPGHFFVEIQDHGFAEQGPLNDILGELAGKLALPLVATNDCHTLRREDAQAQLILQCIQAGQTLQEARGLHHGSANAFLSSPAEMAQRFRHRPEALHNTLRIAEMCAGTADPFGKPQLPRFELPAGVDEHTYLHQLAEAGLAQRLQALTTQGQRADASAYRARLTMELEVICSMGFAGYFLVVQDFINWAKRQGLPVGPGRGSGAGSLVAWSLAITDLDPIPYGLLFERFLNPERVSMPDFDIDFCIEARERVIDYVKQKYGAQSVGQIATFHQLKSRSVVRDVGRVLGMSPAEAGRIATLIPEPVQGKIISIAKAIQQEPRLRAVHEDSATRELLETAMALEDLPRHAGMHAAGVVISQGPLWDHVPVFCPEPGTYVTQYAKDDVEAAGLVKFDFLGLKTLTVLHRACQLVDRRPDRSGEALQLDRLPLDDKATYALLASGETTNVFQLESSGMQTLFKQLKPDRFEDIVAAVALYRPGPLGSGMVEDFVQRKHGRVRVEYPHPSLQPILRDTYGVIVYQEQVMQIARDMAGYSLGGADLLRRAMGKKKAEEMAQQKTIFRAGAQRLGHNSEDADRVFELMAYFAGYGFNKSHSAAYALITYQTAYLKAHFPAEFVCASLSCDRDRLDKVVRTIGEARAMGITVLPPDINESSVDFTVVYQPAAEGAARPAGQPACSKGKLRDAMRPQIRFGLGAIKGVGEAALGTILRSRQDEASGEATPFVDLFDCAARIDTRAISKAVFEALVQSGAFDRRHQEIGVTRAQAFTALDRALERGKKLAAERHSGQTNLFGLIAEPNLAPSLQKAEFPAVDDWDGHERLAREKAALGFYVSGHPLDSYRSELERLGNVSTQTVAARGDGAKICLGGMVEGYRERTTRQGNRLAFFELEDSSGRIEVIVRGKKLDIPGLRELLQSGRPLAIGGIVQLEPSRDGDESTQPKIILDSAEPLAESISKQARAVLVRLAVEAIDRSKLERLRQTLQEHPGACPVSLELGNGSWSVNLRPQGVAVQPSETLFSSLEKLFGSKVYEVQ